MTLFDPILLGDLSLTSRLVMAPMTRNRAGPDGVPGSLMATYYGQRASAGLIVSESTPVSSEAVGYPCTPQLHSDAQMNGWRQVADAVHAGGGRIFVQLQHCGRISHPSYQPGSGLPVAPSALRPEGQAVTYAGMQEFVSPRALEPAEIPRVVRQFQDAAEKARLAGFDGIEVHGANGYLVDQFLRDGTNRRTDEYGGSPSRRMRFLNEVLDTICSVWPAHRIGVRLSPENAFNSMTDSDPSTHFEYFTTQLSHRGLAYLHVLEGDMRGGPAMLDYSALRAKFRGHYIANNGYDLARAQAVISRGDATLVAFGVAFLANPDLVRRLRDGLPLNEADRTTFYGGNERGYTDYPAYHGGPVAAT